MRRRPAALGVRLLIGAILVAALLVPSAATAAAEAEKLTFRVTIKNLSSADLTPVLYGVHNRTSHLFRKGTFASPGIAELAKDGGTSLARSEFRRKRGVRKTGVAGRIAPGKSISFKVTTTRRHLRLSWATMAVCSNDTFAGQDSFRLPAGKPGTRKRVRIRPYDAGAEKNTESAKHVPCLGAHGVGPKERKRIAHSKGIRGKADLDQSTHGWGTYIARVTVVRVS